MIDTIRVNGLAIGQVTWQRLADGKEVSAVWLEMSAYPDRYLMFPVSDVHQVIAALLEVTGNKVLSKITPSEWAEWMWRAKYEDATSLPDWPK